MKNTFAVTMTLLLALTLGGSFAGYRIATTPHHEEGVGAAGKLAEGETPGGGDPTTGKVVSEEAPSAREAATGAAGAPGALGDVMQDQAGGTQSGENGAVAAPGSESNTGTQTGEAQEGDAQDGGAGEAGEASPGEGGATSAAGNAESGSAPGVSEDQAPAAGVSPEDGQGTGADAPSPTAAQSDETTQLGQTGASNVERGMAADPATGDAKAAEVANAITGNTADGQAKFVSACAGCHGQQGQGGIGPNLVATEGPRSWQLAQFEAALREGHAPGRDLGAVMPRFTEEQLSDEDVLNIYTYLRSVN
ncbi:c-type cytochrome [Deinococcus aestuarii]|uniref:c-type cytochrome n=1 Tax=Deinococcus aestuarii TaxID=2774531 RepID=UPI001C0C47E6|nr:c-type cytochrome [Deinococcus aestuarii]